MLHYFLCSLITFTLHLTTSTILIRIISAQENYVKEYQIFLHKTYCYVRISRMTLGEVHKLTKPLSVYTLCHCYLCELMQLQTPSSAPPGCLGVTASYLSRLISFRQKNFLHYYVFTSSSALVLTYK